MKVVFPALVACAAALLTVPLAAQSLTTVAHQTDEARAKDDTRAQSDAKDAKDAKDTKDAKAETPSAPADTSPFAEAAKKAKEARAHGMGWPDPVAPKDIAAGAASARSTSSKKWDGSETKQTESYWRARIGPLHAHIASNMAKRAAMQRRIDELTGNLFDIGPLNTRRGGVEAERQRLVTELDTLTRNIEDDQADVAAIEEEGRRAGALPGWFR